MCRDEGNDCECLVKKNKKKAETSQLENLIQFSPMVEFYYHHLKEYILKIIIFIYLKLRVAITKDTLTMTRVH